MPAERPPLPILGPALEPLYRAAVARRNRAFDAGARVTRLPVPVISIGNISVGGTGKTPMVRWIIQTLRGLGAHPGIAMRGYGHKHAGISDEQQEHADRLPDTPIAANPDRVAASRELVERHHADCIVLDDGFQHRFVARDLDIVLIDATRCPFQSRCLPAGWLREPVASLARAQIIILTRASRVPPETLEHLDSRLHAAFPDAAILPADHHWAALESDRATLPVSWLHARPTFIACAIGNPRAFIDQARDHSARILGTLVRRDHHAWTRRDADRLIEMGVARRGALLTTHKDWVKLRRLHDDQLSSATVRPVVEMTLPDTAAGILRQTLARIVKALPDPVP